MKMHTKITAKVGCYLQMEYLFLDVTYTDIEDLNKFMDEYVFDAAVEITNSWVGSQGFAEFTDEELEVDINTYEEMIIEAVNDAAEYSWHLFEEGDERYTITGRIDWDKVDLT